MSNTSSDTRHTFAGNATEPLLIREATEHDRAALLRLAQRDTEQIPAGRMLVAETGGELRAAVEIESGHAIADPFRRTADLVGLLRARARQLSTAHRGPLRLVARTATPPARHRGVEHAAA